MNKTELRRSLTPIKRLAKNLYKEAAFQVGRDMDVSENLYDLADDLTRSVEEIENVLRSVGPVNFPRRDKK